MVLLWNYDIHTFFYGCVWFLYGTVRSTKALFIDTFWLNAISRLRYRNSTFHLMLIYG